jgi:hypothetical protein
VKKRASIPSPEVAPGPPPRSAIVALVLGIAAFLVYLPTLRYGFVYDDRWQILSDGFIHDIAHLPEVLTGRVFAIDVIDNNRPTMLLSLMLDSLLWGRAPIGYHLTSVLLHASNVILLSLLAVRLASRAAVDRAAATGAPVAPRSRRLILSAAAGGAHFALHPLQTEAVCCVTYREDLLVTFFLVLSLHGALAFGAAPRAPSRWLRGAGVIVGLILAAGAKETGAAGPFLLAMMAVLIAGPPMRNPGTTGPATRRDWLVLTGVGFLAVGGVLAARFLLDVDSSVVFLSRPQLAAPSRWEVLWALQPRIWAWNIGQLLWPAHFSADYTRDTLAAIPLGISRVASAGALAAILAGVRRNRAAILGAVLLAAGLLTVANLIPIYHPMADRFLYLPLAGLALWLAATLARFWPDGRRAETMLAAALVLIGTTWSIATVRRERVWENSLTLWSQTRLDSPRSAVAANGLGFALYDAGRYADAENAWREAIEISAGQYADPWAGLALGLEALGRSAEADAALGEAIALDSRYASTDAMRRGIVLEGPHIERIAPIVERRRAAR